MATCSLILLLLLPQLLFLTTGNLLLAAPVDNFCGKTKIPSRCVQLLKATDERTPTATPQLLEYIAIEAAQGTAGNARIAVANLASATTDPSLKTIYRSCEDSYRNALDELNLGQENFKKHRYGKLVQTSQIVGRVVYACIPAIARNPGLKGANDDTLVLGEVIGIIARAL